MFSIDGEYSSDTLEGCLSKAIPHYDIVMATNLANEMKGEAEKYQKLYELAEQNRVDTIKNSVNYFSFVAMCEKAQTWLSMLEEEKVDRRRKYDEKAFFEVLQSDVSREIIGKDVKIKKIYKCGYEIYAWEIYFDFDGKSYAIDIPDTSKLTVKNVSSTNDGKLTLFLSEGHTLTAIASSYEYDKIKKAFEDYVSEH